MYSNSLSHPSVLSSPCRRLSLRWAFGIVVFSCIFASVSVSGQELVDPQGCKVTIDTIELAQGFQGERLKQYTNVDDCKDYCLRTAGCFAVDFNTNVNDTDYYGCWWYDEPQEVIYDGGEHLTYYGFRRDCPLTTTDKTRNAGEGNNNGGGDGTSAGSHIFTFSATLNGIALSLLVLAARNFLLV